MHKKLAADLTSLAHSVLQLKNKEDVLELKQKAYEIYEKLSVLAYVDEYINTTPNATVTKEELLEKIAAVENKLTTEPVGETIEEVDEVIEEEEQIVEEETIIDEKNIEQPTVVEDLEEETLFSVVPNTEEAKVTTDDKKNITLEEELEDTISVDVAADLFEKPAVIKSLNDQIQQNLQIGLNDRIAFVKHLFEGSQEDFNRVVSQLNSFKTEKEAKKFIKKMVKPDYNWTEKEAYEERFMELVERKFL